MRGRVALIGVLAAAIACLSGASIDAAPGDSTNTGKDDNSGTIFGTARRVGWTGTGGSGPRCTWTRVTGFGVLTVGGSTLESKALGDGYVDQRDDGDYVLYYRSGCTDERSDGFYWIPPVSIADLRRDAYERVQAALPLPSLNMSPDPSVGGFVNLGLWLSVDDPGGRSATAAIGPVWVTVTAAYDSTTWQMGNSDSVVCPGLGVPIVDVDRVDEGPCGYTYRQPSAPQFTGDALAYHASVTGNWVVSWVDHRGASGSLDPIDRTTTFDYQVREIQTVGVANP